MQSGSGCGSERPQMLPLSKLSRDEARNLDGLLFDLDDTFLDEGRLTREAYSALFDLRDAGLALAIVTGRPSGWGDVLFRQWPVRGAVTENGAVLVDRRDGFAELRDSVGEPERQRRRQALAGLVQEMMDRFPELRPTNDVYQRLTDFAFDIGERHRAPEEVIRAASEFATERGARVLRSSVHLHVTWDRADKASGAIRFLHQVLGVDATRARFRFAFIGDSENDAACFAGFATTVGVKNLSGRLTLPPRYITQAESAAGFVELARHLIRLRTSG